MWIEAKGRGISGCHKAATMWLYMGSRCDLKYLNFQEDDGPRKSICLLKNGAGEKIRGSRVCVNRTRAKLMIVLSTGE